MPAVPMGHEHICIGDGGQDSWHRWRHRLTEWCNATPSTPSTLIYTEIVYLPCPDHDGVVQEASQHA